MELELQLLHQDNLDFSNSIIPLMELCSNHHNFKPEFIQNTIEIISDVCNDIDELKQNMMALLLDIQEKCHELKLILCGSGTHLFSKALGTLTPTPRYLAFEQLAGVLSHSTITFATHAHIGLTSGDKAITALNQLQPFVPLIIALAANSPFWRGYDTGYVSYRHRLLDVGRTNGASPYFNDWQDFKRFLSAATKSQYFQSYRDIHWDIRPCSYFGTVEIRVMDAQSSIEDAILVVNFIRLLVRYLLETTNNELLTTSLIPYGPIPIPYWIEKENRYQATRLGMDARFILNHQGDVISLKDLWQKVFMALLSSQLQESEKDYLQALNDKVINNTLGYQQQIDGLLETGSLYKVVAGLSDKIIVK